MIAPENDGALSQDQFVAALRAQKDRPGFQHTLRDVLVGEDVRVPGDVQAHRRSGVLAAVTRQLDVRDLVGGIVGDAPSQAGMAPAGGKPDEVSEVKVGLREQAEAGGGGQPGWPLIPEEEAAIATERAVALAKLGYVVFPLDRRPGREKKPMFKWGKGATRDGDRVRDYWRRHPGAHIAVACKLSTPQLVCIDCDNKNGKNGQAAFLELMQGDPGTSLVARTPSGGMHYVYRAPTDFEVRSRNNSLGPGIDVKAGGRDFGGYFVAPNGLDNRSWLNGDPGVVPPPELPGRLRELLRDRERGSRSEPDSHDVEGLPTTNGTEAFEVQNGNPSAFLLGEIDAALKIIPADDYDIWRDTIFAVHAALRGSRSGIPLIRAYSERATEREKRNPNEGETIYSDANLPGDGKPAVTAARLWALAVLFGMPMPQDGRVSTSALRRAHDAYQHELPAEARARFQAILASGFDEILDEGEADDRCGDPMAIVRQIERDGPLVRVSTGIESLDQMTGGGFPLGSRVYLIGAPDAGKTALVVQMGDEFLRQGIPVAFLGVDEEPIDLMTRLMQRRGVRRTDCEERSTATLARMRQEVGGVPLLLFDGGTAIEGAAAKLHALARNRAPGVDRPPCALIVDSVQAARTAKEAERDGLYAQVTERVGALRAAAKRYRMLVISTSEMNRGAYRSKKVDEQSADMASAKESGAIEFSARVLLSLRNVEGSSDVVALRVVKNKHGPSHRDQDGIFLRVDRAGQQLTEDNDFKPLDLDERRAAGALERGIVDAGKVVGVLCSGDLGVNDLKAKMKSLHGMSPGRTADARAVLIEAGAIEERPSPRGGKQQHLVLDKVPANIRAQMPPAGSGSK